MTLDEFLTKTRHISNLGGGYTFQDVRPRLTCVDGFSMSVQAGYYLYSTPRDNEGPYSEVEIGYPSEAVDEFMNFAEEPERPTDTVYAYVPVEVVEAVIARHGGIQEVSP